MGDCNDHLVSLIIFPSSHTRVTSEKSPRKCSDLAVFSLAYNGRIQFNTHKMCCTKTQSSLFSTAYLFCSLGNTFLSHKSLNPPQPPRPQMMMMMMIIAKKRL